MSSKIFTRIVILALTGFGMGCATTGPSPRYSDAELELAQRHAEDETLARLASSVNTDLAEAANSLARERVTR